MAHFCAAFDSGDCFDRCADEPVSPRQGRFTKLLPAVLVYIGYFIALEFCRDRMADGDLSPAFGLWWSAWAVCGGRNSPLSFRPRRFQVEAASSA